MERLLNQDERIRRAEEIYARRQNLREKTQRATVNVSEPKNFKLLKRLVLQVIICMLIYFIFYLINTTDYSFSEITLSKIHELLSSDTDFVTIYNNLSETIEKNMFFMQIDNGENNNIINEENSSSEEQNEVQEEKDEEEITKDESDVEDGEKVEKLEEINEGEEVSLENKNDEDEEGTDQEKIEKVNEEETEKIKNDYSFINPVVRMGYFRVWK